MEPEQHRIYGKFAEAKTGNSVFKEYGRKNEYIQLNNGQIVRKENAQKFVNRLEREAFLENL